MDNFSGVGGVRGVVELIYIQIYVTTPTKKKVNFVVFFLNEEIETRHFAVAWAEENLQNCCTRFARVSPSPRGEDVANWFAHFRETRRPRRP